MTLTTDRLGLPLLATAQAQKEITHNEALLRADMLMQPIVQSIGLSAPPTAPALGQCWIIGTGASGAWAGNDKALAAYTSSGWRFVAAQEGMSAWSLADALQARYAQGSWVLGQANVAQINVNALKVVGSQQPAITAPSGGSVIDAQCRTTVAAILAALVAHGLIAAH
jgi:Protein of unknown function (DUF2793)